MSECSTVFGIDSRARTTTVCAIVVETGEAATRTFPGGLALRRDRLVDVTLPRTAHGLVRGWVRRLRAGDPARHAATAPFSKARSCVAKVHSSQVG